MYLIGRPVVGAIVSRLLEPFQNKKSARIRNFAIIIIIFDLYCN